MGLGLGAAGCAIDPSPFGPLGGVAMCLDGPAPVDPPTSSVTVVSERGTVVEVARGLPDLPGGAAYGDCGFAQVEGATVRVRDDLGVTWTWGIAAWAGDEDRTPELASQPGDEVAWTMVDVRDFAWSTAGFLTDASGLLWSGDTGLYDTFSMAPEVDAPAPTVRAGAAVGPIERGACGARRRVELEVTGDDAVALDVWEEGQVTVDGVALEARNAGAWRFVGDVRCTDAWGPTPWLVWRP